MQNLLSKLKANQVRLWLDEANNLRFTAPKGALTEELKAAISENKQQLIALLSRNEVIAVDEDLTAYHHKVSFAQQRLLFMSDMLGNSAAYNMPVVFDLVGDFSEQAFKTAFAAIVEKHSLLKSVFNRDGASYRKSEITDEPIAINTLDLSTQQPNENLVEEAIRQTIVSSFDTHSGPLINASIIKKDLQNHVCVINMHHVISDGWSINLLVADLWQFYQSLCRGNVLTSAQTSVTSSYTEFVKWQHQWMQGAQFQIQQKYWVDKLTGAPELIDLPTDFPRPSQQQYQGKTHYFDIPDLLADKLTKVSREYGASTYMTALSVLYVLLNKYTQQTDICIGTPVANRRDPQWEDIVGFFVNVLVLRQKFTTNITFKQLLENVKQDMLESMECQDFPFEKVVEAIQPERNLSYSPLFQVLFSMEEETELNAIEGLNIVRRDVDTEVSKFDFSMSLKRSNGKLFGGIEYACALFESQTIEQFSRHYVQLLDALLNNLDTPIEQVSALTQDEMQAVMLQEHAHHKAISALATVEQQILRTASQHPDKIAIAFNDTQLTYAALNEAVNNISVQLQRSGVCHGDRVAVYQHRTPNVVLSMLAIMAVGAAYVPLDPSYPKERIDNIIKDANPCKILTESALYGSLDTSIELLNVEDCLQESKEKFQAPVLSHKDLAYVIYTSGSTGKPKGVMVDHGNVINLFEALNTSLQDAFSSSDTASRFKALTSISFDISVLELFWTLANGHTVQLAEDHISSLANSQQVNGTELKDCDLDLSLFYFASDTSEQTDKYQLLKEGASFADKNEFSAVWVPERHFHNFGGQFPNPSVAAAAVAATTNKIKIRSGSCVIPLHHPLRVAEEWSMVDNLSNGRVEMAFASGWNFNDFILAPGNFENRHAVMKEAISTVQHLWQGGTYDGVNGLGKNISVSIHPQPVQECLPVWITAAANPATFEYAGQIGANVLTHLLGQSFTELEEKITLYRETLKNHGFDPASRKVALMMHTFISDNDEKALSAIEQPFKDYLRTSINLLKPVAESAGMNTGDDLEAVVDAGFQRYAKSSALFGTPESVLPILQNVAKIGVDEVACLIDFGVDPDAVIDSFQHLSELKKILKKSKSQIDKTSKDPVFSHIQCTPSYAKLMMNQASAKESLNEVEAIFVGGEPLPECLAKEITSSTTGKLYNMYGPTETTVWSAIQEIKSMPPVIGKAILNTEFYVLDEQLNLVPDKVKGELYISGEGVTRGYWQRPDLTAASFIPNPFSNKQGSRMYKTGDLVQRNFDGTLTYHSRVDNQVKVRGFRIELGEIESVIKNVNGVDDAVAIVHQESEGQALVLAYFTAAKQAVTVEEIRTRLVDSLPSYMVPTHVFHLTTLPYTPNGKLSVNDLPKSIATSENPSRIIPAANDIQKALVAMWCSLLKVKTIGIKDNFFEMGGHSLMLGEMQQQIAQQFNENIELIELFKYPTIELLSERLEGANNANKAKRKGRKQRQHNRAAANEMRQQIKERKRRG